MTSTIKNPFRNKMMRARFDDLVRAYTNKGKTLFNEDGTRCRGNSMATEFWRGYDSTPKDMLRWDSVSKNSYGWACFRAGMAMKQGDS